MVGKRDSQVLIVGAGPVGLFAALRLAERGIDVSIIDEQWRTTGRSYALALHPRSLELLESLGLGKDLMAQGSRIESVSFFEGPERRAQLQFSALKSPYPCLLVVPQNQLEGLLEDRLQQKKIRVQWNHRLAGLQVSGEKVEVRIERLEKESSGYAFAQSEWVVDSVHHQRPLLVLGADGHRSSVRRALDISYAPAGPSELFAVFEFEAKGQGPSEMRVMLGQGLSGVLWPMGAGRYRFGFQLPEGTLSAQRVKSRLYVDVGNRPFPLLDEAFLARLIQERAPWFEPLPTEILWSLAVRFDRRMAGSLGRGPVWLAGDAVHLAAPIGVQSMNLGLREVDVWAQAVEAILLRKAPMRTLYDSYGAKFLPLCQDLLVGGNLQQQSPASAWTTPYRTQLLGCVPATGAELQALVSQLGLELSGPMPELAFGP